MPRVSSHAGAMKRTWVFGMLLFAVLTARLDALCQPWTVVKTGTSHTIVVPISAKVVAEGISLTSGDYIGTFYDSAGTLVCAGLERWTGSSISVTAFGDDGTTPVKDGFRTGEEFAWKIWRHGDNKTFDASATYEPTGGIVTNTNTYATNGISSISALSGPPVNQPASLGATIAASGRVTVEWKTFGELQNKGFEVQKSPQSPDAYQTITNSFVPGQGTTSIPHTYSFVDPLSSAGVWYYRIRQIDSGGAITNSEGIRVDVLTEIGRNTVQREFMLSQNYPNPANPTTMIRFEVPFSSFISLKVYNTAGEQVGTLVDGEKAAGTYDVRFNGQGLASGIYFYRLRANNVEFTKKLSLIR
jgi:Secretion system C-terminal sorting domain